MTPPPRENEPSRHESGNSGPGAWSQKDLDELHELIRNSGALKEMVEDYRNARWFRRQAKWWAMWVLGVPAASLAFWEPIGKFIKLLRGQ